VNGPGWTGAIAAVIDGGGFVRGTAFFVGPDVALTCDHVLAAAGDGPISLRQVGSGHPEQVIGEDRDSELDLALVRVPSRADRTQLTLSLDRIVPGSRVYSRGFPRDHDYLKYPDGFPMDPAQISGETTLIWRGQPVEMLVLVDTDVQKGFSGAPAIDMERNSVVGILRFSEDKGQRALAIPAVAATRRWPGLLTDPGKPPRSFTELVDTVAEKLASTAWKKFDPALFHCVVVGSESLSSSGPEDTLAGLVKEVLSSPKATALWDSFRSARGGHRLARAAEERCLALEYAKANVRLATFDVLDAYASPASLELAVRLIVEADLALFDVTHFEAGVMFLLGIRAATRRGVTINSHGAGWREGEPISRPFNLSDLSLSSHTPQIETVGEDHRVGRLVARVCAGFEQLIRQPSYQDLPLYDALRKLGPQEDAWTSIPLEDEVLVLCSYSAKYFSIWKNLRSQVGGALWERDIRTNIVRLQDLATPQLVSQSLYERIRRCTGCIADWTDRSPSTFFELGVRIAVSPWSVVQIADEEWLNTAVSSTRADNYDTQQISRMKALLDPLVYRQKDDSEIGERIARQLVEIRANIVGSSGHRLRQVAAEALRMTEERLPDLFQQLMRDADTFNHQGRIRDNVPQALFYEVTEIKADQERAALERRLAAWFYLEHRLGAGNLAESDERKRLWRELGEVVAADLFLSSDEADQSLALLITERLA
jgi:Trypsin-like peptidase domain